MQGIILIVFIEIESKMSFDCDRFLAL